jgi:hypothetical protein
MRWLGRHVTEGSPWLNHFADVAGDLAKRLGGVYPGLEGPPRTGGQSPDNPLGGRGSGEI